MSAAQQRAEAVRLIKSRTKRNSYTQGANRGYVFGKPEGAVKGYGDCSSTVREVIKRAAGIDIGGNTSAQVANRGKGIMIEDNRDGKRSYPTIDRLTAADCIYYKGTKGNTWDVGHVEMYIGGGEIAGHGSGTGPTIKNCKAYSQSRTGARKYLCVIRWIKDDNITYKLGDRPLSYGMVASDVGELQTLLVQLGYDLGSYGANKNGVDNDYGSKTVKAVKLEQRCAGLAQTGTADVLTIDHIKAHATGSPKPPTMQSVRITGGTVNLRAGSGTKHKVIGVVKQGTVLPSTGVAVDGWLGVVYKDIDAWVSSKYAEVVF